MMLPPSPNKPRVFFDANALIVGAVSPSEHSASLVLLRMAEITLIEGLTSQQVITECERNLLAKIPRALPSFQVLVNRCLKVVDNPSSTDLQPFAGLADPKDLPILVATIQSQSPWLVTFNVRHYQPGHPSVTPLQPGKLVLRIRDVLAFL
ncbi:MAG: PIN domain-containing protein [Anaerolineales bacterium]|jgi:predicted nucleic acid-binding protein|nr:PIN domain-containing protein [Anaerolineales bacterium]